VCVFERREGEGGGCLLKNTVFYLWLSFGECSFKLQLISFYFILCTNNSKYRDKASLMHLLRSSSAPYAYYLLTPKMQELLNPKIYIQITKTK